VYRKAEYLSDWGPVMYHKTDDHTHRIDASIMIRLARREDEPALRAIAQRDSSRLPHGRMLVAQVGSEIRAATSIETQETVADPFHPTSELVRMLSLRLAQLRGSTPQPHGLLGRVIGGRRRSAAPQPAGGLRPLGEFSAGPRA
jgi:hypothetical protein